MNLIARMSVYFAAGVAGGLAANLLLWSAWTTGLTAAMGSALTADLSPAWLCPRLAWSGLWGLAFITPMPGLSRPLKGLFIGLGPAVVQCLVVFPVQGAGFLGLSLGNATPAIILALNLAWGLAAGLWLVLADS